MEHFRRADLSLLARNPLEKADKSALGRVATPERNFKSPFIDRDSENSGSCRARDEVGSLIRDAPLSSQMMEHGRTSAIQRPNSQPHPRFHPQSHLPRSPLTTSDETRFEASLPAAARYPSNLGPPPGDRRQLLDKGLPAAQLDATPKIFRRAEKTQQQSGNTIEKPKPLPLEHHESSIYLHYTISEDRSGSADEVMSQRLAALGDRHRHARKRLPKEKKIWHWEESESSSELARAGEKANSSNGGKVSSSLDRSLPDHEQYDGLREQQGDLSTGESYDQQKHQSQQHGPIHSIKRISSLGNLALATESSKAWSTSENSTKPVRPYSFLGAADEYHKVLDINDPKVLKVYTGLLEFKNDGTREVLVYPPTLNAYQRRTVHTLAHHLGLNHVSRRLGVERRVHVTKPELVPQPQPGGGYSFSPTPTRNLYVGNFAHGDSPYRLPRTGLSLELEQKVRGCTGFIRLSWHLVGPGADCIIEFERTAHAFAAARVVEEWSLGPAQLSDTLLLRYVSSSQLKRLANNLWTNQLFDESISRPPSIRGPGKGETHNPVAHLTARGRGEVLHRINRPNDHTIQVKEPLDLPVKPPPLTAKASEVGTLIESKPTKLYTKDHDPWRDHYD